MSYTQGDLNGGNQQALGSSGLEKVASKIFKPSDTFLFVLQRQVPDFRSPCPEQ